MPLLTTGAGAYPAIGGGGGGFALDYQSSVGTGTTTSPINYGTLSYAASKTRTICIIQYYGGATPTVTGVTIGGAALAQVSGAYRNTGDKSVDVWISTGTLSGTSGAVVVTYGSNNSFNSSVALYSMDTTTPTAGTPATQSTAPAASITTGPVSIPSGGGGIFATFPYSGKTGTITSGNATIDASVLSGGTTFYYAHTTATGSQSVTLTYSLNDQGVSTLVPWGP